VAPSKVLVPGISHLPSAFAIHRVGRPLEQGCDVRLDIHVIEHGDTGGRIEFDQDIDVAVAPLLVARHGTEQGGMSDATRLESRFVCLEPDEDIARFMPVL
jgi:hypothetical protein